LLKENAHDHTIHDYAHDHTREDAQLQTHKCTPTLLTWTYEKHNGHTAACHSCPSVAGGQSGLRFFTDWIQTNVCFLAGFFTRTHVRFVGGSDQKS
jgi:hypothetical protein